MIQELLYTSYEGQGLRKGGGGGFCTVLSTEGMATNMASLLEKLSGYKHPFDLHDPRAKDNPVNYRHAILTLGGTTFQVLSRIADYRREHTGRSNKLAHHVVFTKQDLPHGGPSWTLVHPGLFRADWDRKVTLVPPVSPSAVPDDDFPPGRCNAWAQVAGDAGWAGVVADALLGRPGAVISVLFPLKTDTLALVNDVFKLIPPDRRWDIPFSTYYTSAIPGTSCPLRFVLDGTPEADALRRDYRQTKVDLAAELGRAEDSPLVSAARSGKVSHPEAGTRPRPVRVRRPANQPAPEPAAALPDDPALAELEEGYELDLPVTSRGAPVRRSAAVHVRERSTEWEGRRGRSSPTLNPVTISVAVAALLLFIVLVGAMGGFLLARLTPEPSPTLSPEPAVADGVIEPSDKPWRPPANNNPGPAGGEPDQPAGTPNPDESPGDGNGSAPPQDEPPYNPSPPVPHGNDEPHPQEPPVSALAWRLQPIDTLPWLQQDTDVDTLPQTVLARGLPAEAVSMTLEGLDTISDGRGAEGQLTQKALDDGGLEVHMTWGDQTSIKGEQQRKIARFTRQGSEVLFAWDPEIEGDTALGSSVRRPLANALRWCKLKIEAEGKPEFLVLSQPFPVAHVPLAKPGDTPLVPPPDARIKNDTIAPAATVLSVSVDSSALDQIEGLAVSVSAPKPGTAGTLVLKRDETEVFRAICQLERSQYDTSAPEEGGRLSLSIRAKLWMPSLANAPNPDASDNWFTMSDAAAWEQARRQLNERFSEAETSIKDLKIECDKKKDDIADLVGRLAGRLAPELRAKAEQRKSQLETSVSESDALISKLLASKQLAESQRKLLATLQNLEAKVYVTAYDDSQEPVSIVGQWYGGPRE